ncbi:hypothetical protein C1646_759115 [Rhizophagus diaphanus]|nr:hypothetical protein C1646_759115 [Rhizophagus diaphanus] [Rhizophagus sp. MUCL 43196]
MITCINSENASSDEISEPIATQPAKNILMLFGEKGVGIDRIKLVTYNASDISRLINIQIQNIIDYVNNQIYKTITIGNDQSHMTLAEMISSVTPQTIHLSREAHHAQ